MNLKQEGKSRLAYEIRLEEFSGPVEKLLELIEEQKLEINRVSLAKVTADFFKYIDSLEEVNPRILADFIAVAAKLILIKSHTLLPELRLEEAEEKEIVDLENRLKFYQEFRGAEENLKHLWRKRITFGRDYLANLPRGFYLSDEVAPTDLLKEIERIAVELEALSPRKTEETIRLITLEEKISELMERLDKVVGNSFNEIASGKERSEIIILFLALLHLLKEAIIKVDQDKLFSEIKITKNRHGDK